jgi:hypothetical protein
MVGELETAEPAAAEREGVEPQTGYDRSEPGRREHDRVGPAAGTPEEDLDVPDFIQQK